MKLTVGQIVIATCVIVACVIMVALFVLNANVFETAAKEPLMLIAGALIAALTTVINWFFGSSKGSSDKTGILLNTLKELTPNVKK